MRAVMARPCTTRVCDVTLDILTSLIELDVFKKPSFDVKKVKIYILPMHELNSIFNLSKYDLQRI